MDTTQDSMVRNDAGISPGNAGEAVEGYQPFVDALAGGIIGAETEVLPEPESVLEAGESANQPEPATQPAPLTEAMLRKLRAKYFTVRHPVVPECGHKIDQINEPKTNCHTCWYVWFEIHPQLVEVADQFYKTEGKRPLIGMRGEKFVKFFEKYMSTKYNELLEKGATPEEIQERNPNGTSGQSGTGGDSGTEEGNLDGTPGLDIVQDGEAQISERGDVVPEQDVRYDSSSEVGQAEADEAAVDSD